MKKEPKLRTAQKIEPPYRLGKFPKTFAVSVGKQIIYFLATKSVPSLEGPEWERIFANAIGANWKPSNVGLDDIVLKNCAWGAKSVKSTNPWKQETVRLISGRNSPAYSFGSSIDVKHEPRTVGEEIIQIWNKRVDAIRSKYAHVRTVVLIKSGDLLELTIFERELIRFDHGQYDWTWNVRGNLEGSCNGTHKFTWQPHGSQFTIVEEVPSNKLCLKLRNPNKLEEASVLKIVGFDKSWIKIIDPDKI